MKNMCFINISLPRKGNPWIPGLQYVPSCKNSRALLRTYYMVSKLQQAFTLLHSTLPPRAISICGYLHACEYG